MDDLISRQAVKELAHNQVREKYCGMALKEHRDFYIKLADSIIDLLPSAQPEQTGCEYCHKDVDGYVKPIEKNGHVFVRFGMNGWELELKAKGWHGDVKIQYCPMCGRKLKNDK